LLQDGTKPPFLGYLNFIISYKWLGEKFRLRE
jgi:hypothetical protein